ncbi:alpha/beta hydrolase family protein [Treponema pedis]|uniref:Dienelactone hydrolase family protein n=1 Tax=Treponema pedis TaxID=409322 RepID=A0A7S7AWE9_9SPIR|nr:dienelactone hydrolase family protein [Treponema pedis]QOW61235.1 dienelactone hydrolase family protein [Treponema pedis]
MFERIKRYFLIIGFFCFFGLYVFTENKTDDFIGSYEIKAYNDVSRIGFNNVYKSIVKDNTYDKTLSDKENLRGEITVYLPKKTGKYPLIMITHGWANSKLAFLSLGRYIASHGYAAAVFTSKKRSLPKDWLPAFSSVYGIINEAVCNKNHSMYNSIDMKNIGIIAHSMGGAAALYYANFIPEVKAVAAIHPYNGSSVLVETVGSSNEELGDSFTETNAAVLILTSEIDITAYPEKTYRFFKNLNKNNPACFLSFQNVKHNGSLDIYRTPLSGGYNEPFFKLYAGLDLAWFDVFLKNKRDGLEYFKPDGEKFKEIKNFLYEKPRGEHEVYPNYDSRNLE